MLIADLKKNKFVVSFIIIFGILSFCIQPTAGWPLVAARKTAVDRGSRSDRPNALLSLLFLTQILNFDL